MEPVLTHLQDPSRLWLAIEMGLLVVTIVTCAGALGVMTYTVAFRSAAFSVLKVSLKHHLMRHWGKRLVIGALGAIISLLSSSGYSPPSPSIHGRACLELLCRERSAPNEPIFNCRAHLIDGGAAHLLGTFQSQKQLDVLIRGCSKPPKVAFYFDEGMAENHGAGSEVKLALQYWIEQLGLSFRVGHCAITPDHTKTQEVKQTPDHAKTQEVKQR